MAKVSPSDPRPAYVQIADQLRAAIADGSLKLGVRLPTGRVLAEQYGVAPMTMQNALRLLRDEGRLVAWQGRGVFVAEEQPDFGAEGPSSEVSRRIEHLTRAVDDLRDRVSALEGRDDGS